MKYFLCFVLSILASPIRPLMSLENNFGNFETFEIEALEQHNRLRALHRSPPLTLNKDLCNFARQWAQYLADRNIIQHRPNNKYGENIFWAGGMEIDGRTAVTNWYSEIEKFDFQNGGFSMETGHFTQVVWKNSKELGIGMAKRGNSVWVVANYSPPGNYAGQFRENVLPPLSWSLKEILQL